MVSQKMSHISIVKLRERISKIEQKIDTTFSNFESKLNDLIGKVNNMENQLDKNTINIENIIKNHNIKKV